MKRIKIPLIDKEICIYIGEKEWENWRKSCIKLGGEDIPDDMPEDNGDGVTFLAQIWMYSKDDISTIFHEIQHSLSAIFTYLGCEDEEEMRAYIAGYVNNEIQMDNQLDKEPI